MDKRLRQLQRTWESAPNLDNLRRYIRELIRADTPIDQQEFDYLSDYLLEYLNSEFRTLELLQDAHRFIRWQGYYLRTIYGSSFGWFSQFIANPEVNAHSEITTYTFQHYPNLARLATEFFRGLEKQSKLRPYLFYSKRHNNQQNVLEIGSLPKRVWDSIDFTTGEITWSSRIMHGEGGIARRTEYFDA